jgi:AraC-like DNA-binding protein
MAVLIKNLSQFIHRAYASRVQFGEVVYQPGGAVGPRVQKQYQLVLLIRGEANIEVNGHDHPLPAGHVALFRPKGKEFFRFSQTEETHHSWCSIDPPLVTAALQRELRAAPFHLPISETMSQLIALGLRTRGSKEDEALLCQLALAALCAFTREARAAESGPAFPEALLRARDLIESEYGTKLTLGDVARRCGLSPNHLIKLFRRHLHETPARYLWRLRVDHGVRLLRETGLSVSEIAYRTGFQNPFHFSRMVKTRYRVSPRGLRLQWWGRPGD